MAIEIEYERIGAAPFDRIAVRMTEAIRRRAAEVLPAAQADAEIARGRERAALRAAGGEAGWSALGGHEIALSADRAWDVVNILRALSAGRNESYSHGAIWPIEAHRALRLPGDPVPCCEEEAIWFGLASPRSDEARA